MNGRFFCHPQVGALHDNDVQSIKCPRAEALMHFRRPSGTGRLLSFCDDDRTQVGPQRIRPLRRASCVLRRSGAM